MLLQLLVMMGKPGRQHIYELLKHKLSGDPDPAWAVWSMMGLTEPVLQCLIQAAREEEDKALSAVRKSRGDSYNQWAAAETKGSLKQICRWIREGSRKPSEFGLFTTEGGELLAGEAGLIEAVDKAWWPLWKPGVDRRTRPARFEALGGGQMPALDAAMIRAAC